MANVRWQRSARAVTLCMYITQSSTHVHEGDPFGGGGGRTLTISRQIPLLPRQQPVEVKIPISDPQEPVSGRRESAR